MGYNIYYELVSSIFLGLMLVSVQVRRRDMARHSTIFRLLVLVLITTAILDIITAILIDNQSLVPIPLNKALNSIYFLMPPTCAYFFLIYILSYRRLPEKVLKTIKVLSTGSLAVYFVLCLVNIKAGFIFTHSQKALRQKLIVQCPADIEILDTVFGNPLGDYCRQQ